MELYEGDNDSVLLLRSPSLIRWIMFHLWNAFASRS